MDTLSAFETDLLICDLFAIICKKPRPKIQLIEDDKNIFKMVDYISKDAKFDLKYSATGREAFQSIAKELPDLIILDLNLPDISGFKILQFLQRNQRYREIPTIILTSSCDDLSLVSAMKLGAVDFIEKPLVPNYLLKVVNSNLKTRNANT